MKNFIIKGTVNDVRNFLKNSIEKGFKDTTENFEDMVTTFNINQSNTPVNQKTWGLVTDYDMTFGIVTTPSLNLTVAVSKDSYDKVFHLPEDYDKAVKECSKVLKYYEQKNFRVIELNHNLKAKVMECGDVELTQKSPYTKLKIKGEQFLPLVDLLIETNTKLDAMFPQEHNRITSRVNSVYLSNKNLEPIKYSDIFLIYNNFLLLNNREVLAKFEQ
jgi:hypothetical protein